MKIWNVHTSNHVSTVVLLMASQLLFGCTTVLQPVKPASMTTYALDVQLEPVATTGGEMTLLVNTPIAHSGFDSSRMAYITKPYEIDYFSQNQWIASPARMLLPLLVQTLEHTAQFRAVVQARSAARADLRLDTEIIRLQQEFLVLPSQVHLTMRAQLLDIQGKSVLATHVFDITENTSSDDPYGGVAATNVAVKKMLLQIGEFCAQVTKSAKFKKSSE